MKDITLGQYYPVDSLIHRLDPRTKLAGTLIYIIALFVAKGPCVAKVIFQVSDPGFISETSIFMYLPSE